MFSYYNRDFTVLFSFPFPGQQGSRDSSVVRALASQKYAGFGSKKPCDFWVEFVVGSLLTSIGLLSRYSL